METHVRRLGLVQREYGGDMKVVYYNGKNMDFGITKAYIQILGFLFIYFLYKIFFTYS